MNIDGANLSRNPMDLRFDKVDVSELSHCVLLAHANFVSGLHTLMAELRLQAHIRPGVINMWIQTYNAGVV